jgi:prefoldin subunit 5
VGAYGIPEPTSREQQIDLLKDEAQWLKEQLEAINQRMESLGQE